jgi:predicted membrane protein (TIGR00267 family)
VRENIQNAYARFRQYSRIVSMGEIARRYFAMNAFDGVLTIIGVLMGNFTAGIRDARIVVSTGLATTVAIGISGLWGAYLTESAERTRELAELEAQTLSDLGDTSLGMASRMAVVVVAIVDGLAPFLAALFVLLPFFVPDLFPSLEWVYGVAIGMAMLALFALGGFLGYISRQNMVLYGLRTLVAGVVSIGISLLLGGEGV